MTTTAATDPMPLRDLQFLLWEVLRLPELLEAPRYDDHDDDTVLDMLSLARAMALDVFAPTAAVLDAHPPELVDGRVRMHPMAKEALAAYLEAGFQTAGFAASDGGMQLPYVVTAATNMLFGAANTPLLVYSSLTQAAANLLVAHGSDELKGEWLTPMIEGRFYGTMALSETQAGSSLADLTTRAERQPDGSYRLVGSKMWITGTDHDLGENIVNLVLARTPDAPPGTRGISLFLVPQYLQDEAGAYTVANDVRVVGLNHKMGFRAAVNTVWALGDDGGAVGWLVGEENQGLKYMFHVVIDPVGTGAMEQLQPRCSHESPSEGFSHARRGPLAAGAFACHDGCGTRTRPRAVRGPTSKVNRAGARPARRVQAPANGSIGVRSPPPPRAASVAESSPPFGVGFFATPRRRALGSAC